MARLPTYTNQQSLDTGSDTFRLSPDTGAAIAQGIGNFGAGLVSAGEQLGRAQKRLDAKTDAAVERDGALRDEAEFIRLQNRINQFAKDQKERTGDDANGYTVSIEQFAQTEYDNLLKSGVLSSNNKAKHDLLYERAARPEVNRAAEYEAQTRFKFQSDVYEARLKDLTGFVAASGATGIDQAKAEWRSIVDRTGGTDSRVGKKFLEIGERRIEQQAFLAEAKRRGPEFLSQFQGLFTNTPSAVSGNPQVDAALKYAPVNNVDPRTAVAVGWIESRLTMDHDGPRLAPGAARALGRKGATHMSSAEGGWQILDGVARDFGLSIEEKKDPEKATAAIMRHFASNQDRLTAMGQTVTPGKVYMMWNVGAGVAERIMRADANTPIEQVIFAAYPSRPQMAMQVLRNNPSLYKAGMTVGQVRENYELQMQRATAATEKYFNGTVQSTESSRAAVSTFMGRDMAHVSTADLMETFADVSKTVKVQSAEERNIAEGEMHLANPGFGDPYDTHRRKVVNAAVENRIGDDVVLGIGRGDVQSVSAGEQYTTAAGFIPDKVLHGYRSALDSNSTDPAMLALQSLSRIATDDPKAFGASSLQSDERDMVRDFRAMTEVLRLDPATATKQILASRTPEGKKEKQVIADKIRAEWRNGGSDIDAEATAWKDVSKHFDQSYFSDPDVATDSHREAIVEAYRQTMAHYRLKGDPIETAKAKALGAINTMWGVSNVASNGRSQTLMPLPPEKVLAGKAIDGSFQWVQDQARNVLYTYLDTNKIKAGSPDLYGEGRSPPEFSLIPKEGSQRDFIDGRDVKYEIWFRDPKGMIQRAVGVDFAPNYADAKRKADEDFAADRTEIEASRIKREEALQRMRRGN